MATVLKQSAAPKRIGRPFKAPPKGKRAPLSLLVRPEIKRLVDKRAKANSRTQSQEAEMMIERCLQYEQMMEALRTDDDALVVSMFRRKHTPVHTPYGDIWMPKGHPEAPKTGSFQEPTK